MANKMTEAALRAQREYNSNYRRNKTPEQREQDRAYHREWQRQNKDKCRQYVVSYWERKAAKAEEAKPSEAN